MENQPGNLAESWAHAHQNSRSGPLDSRNGREYQASDAWRHLCIQRVGDQHVYQQGSARHYLIASDFDQTLSFNDSGLVLSELIGVPNFREKVAGLSDIHLVQQGAELTYLLRHDPEFRCVRREHLIETGKQVRLKKTSRAS